jgi:hypothetical protein
MGNGTARQLAPTTRERCTGELGPVRGLRRTGGQGYVMLMVKDWTATCLPLPLPNRAVILTT